MMNETTFCGVNRVEEWANEIKKQQYATRGAMPIDFDPAHAHWYKVCPLEDRVAYQSKETEPVLLRLGESVVTQNRAALAILNHPTMFIADVDRESLPYEGRVIKANEDDLRQTLSALGKGGSYRLYETRAGWRVIRTDVRMGANCALARCYLDQLQSDPLYVQLCKEQQCYRARLDPKPWRLDTDAYEHVTCRLMDTFGASYVRPEFRDAVELHDLMTGASRHAENQFRGEGCVALA